MFYNFCTHQAGSAVAVCPGAGSSCVPHHMLLLIQRAYKTKQNLMKILSPTCSHPAAPAAEVCPGPAAARTVTLLIQPAYKTPGTP
jgi:hypothetical protein